MLVFGVLLVRHDTDYRGPRTFTVAYHEQNLRDKKKGATGSPVTPQKFWHTEGQSQNLRVCDTLRVTKNIVVADASMNNCMTIFEQS